jgi:hypothetical protein
MIGRRSLGRLLKIWLTSIALSFFIVVAIYQALGRTLPHFFDTRSAFGHFAAKVYEAAFFALFRSPGARNVSCLG